VSRYLALLDGGRREVAIEVEEDGPARYQVSLGGRVHRVDAFRHDHGTVSLLIDTASHSATFDERGAQVRVRTQCVQHFRRRLRVAKAQRRRAVVADDFSARD
jgi:hypothetical protein